MINTRPVAYLRKMWLKTIHWSGGVNQVLTYIARYYSRGFIIPQAAYIARNRALCKPGSLPDG